MSILQVRCFVIITLCLIVILAPVHDRPVAGLWRPVDGIQVRFVVRPELAVTFGGVLPEALEFLLLTV